MALTKIARRARIKMRIRKIVNGTAEAPRLTVFRSNKQIYAQVIDDQAGKTLVAASSRDKDVAEAAQGKTKTAVAALVGQAGTAQALADGITAEEFDHNGHLSHSQDKQPAEAAREGGLQF